jgi:hypothetical protein
MKKVVYTCITGGYDDLKEPMVITEGWDYICFCDEYPQHKDDTIWKIILIGETEDRIRHQRKKKIYNEYILDEYDLSVWVDGSMYINCDLNEFIQPMMEMGYDFAIMNHPAQNCIVGEAKGILALRKDKQEVLEQQINDYFEEGYPKNNGMVASGIMIRRHTEQVKELCKFWYGQVEKYSLRDQMSFNYSLWKNPMEVMLMPFDLIYSKFRIQRHLKNKLF